jgi:hypothetical protein
MESIVYLRFSTNLHSSFHSSKHNKCRDNTAADILAVLWVTAYGMVSRLRSAVKLHLLVGFLGVQASGSQDPRF